MGVDVHDTERTWTVRGARRLTPPSRPPGVGGLGMPGGHPHFGAPPAPHGGYGGVDFRYGYGGGYPMGGYGCGGGTPPPSCGAYGMGSSYSRGMAPRPGDDFGDWTRRHDDDRRERERSRERGTNA
jgi:hypothetical protein